MMGGAGFAQEFQFAPSSSNLEWVGKKVVGGSHEGTLAIKSGSIHFTKQQPTKAEVVVDMKSLLNTDLKDAEWNQKLVGHLHSDDFFATAIHPVAKIVVTSFKGQGKGQYKMNGLLTIKGVTKPIAFNGQMIKKSGAITSINAQLQFDRTLYNVKYGSGKFFSNLGDKMISDMVAVKVNLKLKKPIKMASH